MKARFFRFLIAPSLAIAASVLGNTAQAVPIPFQGSDPGANSTDPRPLSDAAAASFDAAAGALGTVMLINFESAPVGAFTSLAVAPGVTLTGTDFANNNQEIRNSALGSPDGVFGYNTTAGGANFLSLLGGTATFTFTNPINCFGAYFSGVQLIGETITFNDGSSQTIFLTGDFANGGVQFAGFTDAGKFISSVTITARAGNTDDIIGVDDVRFVLANGQAAVPETGSTMVLLGGVFGSLVLLRRVSNVRRRGVIA